jgi:hypothetical protein
MMRGLRTVAAVLGASSRFDRQQETALDVLGVVEAQMLSVRASEEIEEGKTIKVQCARQAGVNAQVGFLVPLLC